jgi:hypothetical protein
MFGGALRDSGHYANAYVILVILVYESQAPLPVPTIKSMQQAAGQVARLRLSGSCREGCCSSQTTITAFSLQSSTLTTR